MPISIVQNGDGSAGLVGLAPVTGEFIYETLPLVAASVAATIITASRPLKVVAINYRPDVAGTDAGAVTFVVNKAASAIAPASGTIVHSGTANLKGTVNTNQALTLLATSVVYMAAGDSLCFVPTGVLTAVVGTITVGLQPI